MHIWLLLSIKNSKIKAFPLFFSLFFSCVWYLLDRQHNKNIFLDKYLVYLFFLFLFFNVSKKGAANINIVVGWKLGILFFRPPKSIGMHIFRTKNALLWMKTKRLHSKPNIFVTFPQCVDIDLGAFLTTKYNFLYCNTHFILINIANILKILGSKRNSTMNVP